MKSLQGVSEETVWIENFSSACSKRTYRIAVEQFAGFFGMETPEQLRSVTGAHVIGFRNHLQEIGKSPRTVNNRLSALSSLFDHLVERQILRTNPVRSVKRMKINDDRVEARVLGPDEARRMLDSPDVSKFRGLRDRAVFGVLLFTGCRVSELCGLKVRDYYRERGFGIVDFRIKGGKRNRLAVNQELRIFLDEYLAEAVHGDGERLPLILPANENGNFGRFRHISARQIGRIWGKYAKACGIEGTTPHSARATFITQALENNCPIEAVQRSVGHSRIETTRMYDKRTVKFRESASFAVRY